ncbi:MAG TPA: ABC transporter ATP-binding protein, partial [Anaeromyxobacteraceae bacterium]|nr:ABC transporter ATP-binding protein [Anaeromyxobacteraceae bacterium]
LFVSHNRSFLNGLATRIWEVKDGGIVDQPGNLDDWLYHQQQLQLEGGAAATDGERPEALRDGGTEKDRRRREAEARNARRAREKPLRDAIAELEARIAALETQERAAEAALADPALYQDFARARPHVEALASAKDELARLYPEWESKQLELETLAAG